MKKSARPSDDHTERGWYLFYRATDQQWEVNYRVSANVWKKHRVPRQVATESEAEKYAESFVKEKRRLGFPQAVARSRSGRHVPVPVGQATTFADFARTWTNGQLHAKHPDHVRAKSSAADDGMKLDLLMPAIGAVPLDGFTLEHAELAMARLDELRQRREDDSALLAQRRRRVLKPLSPSTRRQYAQFMHKVLAMAVYPARLIAVNPLPKGFLPKPAGEKPLAYLYPDEDSMLMRCEGVPLSYRIFYGFLAREGMREGEALALTFGDVDLERGAVTLDENKTDEPRAWALSPGVRETLTAWRESRITALVERVCTTDGVCSPPIGVVLLARPAPLTIGARLSCATGRHRSVKRSEQCARYNDREPVFVDERGRPISKWGVAGLLRAHLALAGVRRPELLKPKPPRKPIRVHDLRATFVTLALANGRTEAWVSSRTGHRSSQMINRYRRAAQKVEELALGALLPLDVAIPEMASHSSPSAPPKGHSDIVRVLSTTPSVSSQSDAARFVAGLVAGAMLRNKPREPSARNERVGRAGLEPATYGLKDEHFQQVESLQVTIGGISAEFVEAADAGDDLNGTDFGLERQAATGPQQMLPPLDPQQATNVLRLELQRLQRDGDASLARDILAELHDLLAE